MPIFEYQCLDCAETFEKLHLSRSREESTECPSCGSDRTERLVSSFATGSGAYGVSGSSCGTGSRFR